MRKHYLLALLMLGLFTVVDAQDFGLRAGVNIATQNFDGDGVNVSPDSRLGLYVGAIAKFGLTDALDLRVELNYCQYGFKLSDDVVGDFETVINQLDIPILLQYDLKLGDALGAYLAAGPQLGYALNGKNKIGDSEDDIDFDADEYSRLDLGLAFGGGVGFGVAGDNMLYLELRYYLGLMNLDTSDDDGKLTNRGLQLGLAYMF